MKNRIVISNVEVNHNICKVYFECSADLECYFDLKHEFYCEYTKDIQAVPNSIVIIPFICNVLPLIWFTDSVLEVDSIDKDFYNSIENFKFGYKKMYPNLNFRGTLKVNDLEYNSECKCGEQKCGAFFSGGVDAFATLIAHINERPDLITVCGSDITIEDKVGWERVWSHTTGIAKQFGLHSIAIKTNFRTFINNKNLDILCRDGKDSWWHGFQHGIGLLGLSAPLAWTNGYQTVYIASSFTEADRTAGNYTCASDPDIDGNVRFCGCKVVHDLFDCTRQEKIMRICQFGEQRHIKLDVRVCYAVEGGINCCACEKCIRTIMGIYACGAKPENYGFTLNHNLLKGYKRTVVSRVTRITLPFWIDIQKMIKSKPELDIPQELDWIKTIDIIREKKSIGFNVDLFLHKAIGKIRRKFKF